MLQMGKMYLFRSPAIRSKDAAETSWLCSATPAWHPPKLRFLPPKNCPAHHTYLVDAGFGEPKKNGRFRSSAVGSDFNH